jgi:hypothetical protein
MIDLSIDWFRPPGLTGGPGFVASLPGYVKHVGVGVETVIAGAGTSGEFDWFG